MIIIIIVIIIIIIKDGHANYDDDNDVFTGSFFHQILVLSYRRV
jgi:hypothetical protein